MLILWGKEFVDDKTKDFEKQKKEGTSSKVSDSRLDNIKKEMDSGLTETDSMTVIDGQVGFDELLEKQVASEISEDATVEDIKNIYMDA